MPSSTYKLKTIDDILEQIPEDRFEVFLAELPEGLRQLRALKDLAKVAAEITDAPVPTFEGMTWVDDGVEGISKVRLSITHQGEVITTEEVSL